MENNKLITPPEWFKNLIDLDCYDEIYEKFNSLKEITNKDIFSIENSNSINLLKKLEEIKKNKDILSLVKPEDLKHIISNYNLKCIIPQDNLSPTKINNKLSKFLSKKEIGDYYNHTDIEHVFNFGLYYKNDSGYDYNINTKIKILGKNLIFRVKDFYKDENIKSENCFLLYSKTFKLFLIAKTSYWEFETKTNKKSLYFSDFKKKFE